MLCKLGCAALVATVWWAATVSPAQTPPSDGPPPWRDQASVYLNLDRPSTEAHDSPQRSAEPFHLPINNSVEEAASHETGAELESQQPARFDAFVQAAVHQSSEPNATPAAATSNTSQRRLAPPTSAVSHSANRHARATQLPSTGVLGLPWESISSTLAALGIVLGFFLICTWILRRGARRTTAALPREVVSVLGRVPIAARNVAQLLRVGNKLVLVSITPAGAETLTEVTDPAEVDRLLGLCQQSDRHSATKEFENVFRQLSLEPAADGFLGNIRGDNARGR